MPVQNKACHERHVKKCQDNHRLRLAKMKPTIDCHAPSSMRKVAAKTNAKKQQIMVSQPLPRSKYMYHHHFFFSLVIGQTLCTGHTRLRRTMNNPALSCKVASSFNGTVQRPAVQLRITLHLLPLL